MLYSKHIKVAWWKFILKWTFPQPVNSTSFIKKKKFGQYISTIKCIRLFGTQLFIYKKMLNHTRAYHLPLWSSETSTLTYSNWGQKPICILFHTWITSAFLLNKISYYHKCTARTLIFRKPIDWVIRKLTVFLWLRWGGKSAPRHMVQLTGRQKTKRKKTCSKHMKLRDRLGSSERQTYTDSHRVTQAKRTRAHANPCWDTRPQRSQTQRIQRETEGEDAMLSF